MENQMPRRAIIALNVPAEKAIRNAMLEVEQLVADPSLTEAIIKLQQSLELVSDYIDAQFIK